MYVLDLNISLVLSHEEAKLSNMLWLESLVNLDTNVDLLI